MNDGTQELTSIWTRAIDDIINDARGGVTWDFVLRKVRATREYKRAVNALGESNLSFVGLADNGLGQRYQAAMQAPNPEKKLRAFPAWTGSKMAGTNVKSYTRTIDASLSDLRLSLVEDRRNHKANAADIRVRAQQIEELERSGKPTFRAMLTA